MIISKSLHGQSFQSKLLSGLKDDWIANKPWQLELVNEPREIFKFIFPKVIYLHFEE